MAMLWTDEREDKVWKGLATAPAFFAFAGVGILSVGWMWIWVSEWHACLCLADP
ncbi:hypothetical protein [Rhizobium sp. NFR03]|uniref:hypothetical protein n=1 Tax=Rhizobium sp. NFR03 TaxID=1566263 RepID=UPI00147BFF43|nr:hypothetical protein [Rhizobium sp. NFR03]